MASFILDVDDVNWGKDGLVPCITQDYFTREVLMLAYMNRESLALSCESGFAHYFSRSRMEIWKKGEESGNLQEILELSLDCDNDTVLLIVRQIGGVACHCGERSCFYKRIKLVDGFFDRYNGLVGDNRFVANGIIHELYLTLLDRKDSCEEVSYTSSLFSAGENVISKKVIEEASEFCFALKDNREPEIVHESVDLLYHFLVALAFRGVSLCRVEQEVLRRMGVSGIDEKKSRVLDSYAKY